MRNSVHLPSRERSGLLFALAGFVLLSFGDAVVKTLAGEWPPTAVAALRYVAGALGLSALLGFRQGDQAAFAMPHPRVQFLRGLGVAMATVGFFSAVFVMPLAAATAITFTSPMLTAILAAVFLKEPANRTTWLATALAFVGVLVLLRPNLAAIGPAALLPLLAALGMSLLMIGNRFVAGSASPLAMQVFVAAMAAPVLVVAALLGHWSGRSGLALTIPDWTIVARCLLVALSASTAHWLIFVGTTRAGAASIAPMTYVQLLVATALGWIFFGNRPDLLTLLGGAIIVGAGLLLWHAGRVRVPVPVE
ncbi:MAG: DMT family transporter [Novosphingobium sp.]